MIDPASHERRSELHVDARSLNMGPDRGDGSHEAVRRGSNSELRESLSDHELSETTLVSDPSPSNPLAKQLASDLGLYATQSNHHESIVDATNFTFRGVVVGILIGVIICFSNTYFGLQTGWVSGMVMPASLIGFAWFKAISKHLRLPFTPVENVLVQTVAGAVGTMPLGLGFVGVMPSLEDAESGDHRVVPYKLDKLPAWMTAWFADMSPLPRHCRGLILSPFSTRSKMGLPEW